MSHSQNRLLSCCDPKKEKLAMIFFGNVCDTYALKLLLTQTQHEVIVFHPDASCQSEVPVPVAENICDKNQVLLDKYQKDFRTFLIQPVSQSDCYGKPLETDSDAGEVTPSLSSPAGMLKALVRLKQNYDFNDCFLLFDSSHFTDPVALFDFNQVLQKNTLGFCLHSPFAAIDPDTLLVEACQSSITYETLNLYQLHQNNQVFIQTASDFLSGKISPSKLELTVQSHQINFSEAYLYAVLESRYDLVELLLRAYADHIPSKLVLLTLGQMGLFSPEREDIISLGLTTAKASTEDISNIGAKLVKQLIQNESATNRVEAIALKLQAQVLEKNLPPSAQLKLFTENHFITADYFLRAYGFSCEKIQTNVSLSLLYSIDLSKINNDFTPATLDLLKTFDEAQVHTYADNLQTHFVRLFFERMLEKGADIGELICQCIRYTSADTPLDTINFLLNEYQSRFHTLQLNEALLNAFSKGLFALCDQLISAGAEKKLIEFHLISYGLEKAHAQAIKVCSKWRAYDDCDSKDQDITKVLLKLLGHPEQKVPPVFHVTGSNGKGSVCTFIRSILEHNGYRVHSFMSPAIIRDNENYIVSGKEISDETFYEYLQRVIATLKTFFESDDYVSLLSQWGISKAEHHRQGLHPWNLVIPAIALAFSENPADATIVEVVVGGEQDYTNIFDSSTTAATVVNTIFQNDNHPHAGIFRTIEARAETKARLSKPHVPIISAQQETAVSHVIKAVAAERQSDLHICGESFTAKLIEKEVFEYHGFNQHFKLKTPRMIGDYQMNNAAIALSAILSAKTNYTLNEKEVSEGIYTATQRGRMSFISDNPDFSDLHSLYPGKTPNMYHGSVKDKKGLISFLKTMKLKHADQPFVFVINMPSISERVISGVEQLHQFGLNIKSIRIYNTLAPRDFKVLEYKTKSFQKNISTISNSLASCLLHSPVNEDEILCLVSFGLEILPKNLMFLLQKAHQEHFESDLDLARQFFSERPHVQYLLSIFEKQQGE